MNIILTAALLVVLVALSAFFSSSEIAFAMSNKLRIKKAAENGSKVARISDYINENYGDSLSTILVGNNLVNIAASSVATMLAVDLLGAKGQSVATVCTTIVLLIFGETIPKILAADIPDTFAKIFAYPLRFFMYFFKPVVWSVSLLIERIRHLWTPKEQSPQVTAEELCELLETIEDEGVFTEEEGDLIRSAIEFTDIMAHEILVPRVDVVAIDIDDWDMQITDEMLVYSRIPVYKGSIDNIIGILPMKKLIKAIAAGENIDLTELIVPAIFVHKTRMISSIINEFRNSHLQMAVVVDEYGGTMGILTMEDIMEELVGEIFDERDEVEDDIICETTNSYVVDGSTNLYDLFDLVDYEPIDFDSEYTTVGGWATEMLDKFPSPGDKFVFDRFSVEVLEAQSMRVEKLHITLLPPPEENE